MKIIKQNISSIKTIDGSKHADITVETNMPIPIRSLLLSLCFIGFGLFYLASESYKKGSLDAMDAQYEAEKKIGVV